MECDNPFVRLELWWKVIAAAVMSDPTTYTEAILGKPNQEYVEWISKPDKWGGNLWALKLAEALVLIVSLVDNILSNVSW